MASTLHPERKGVAFYVNGLIDLFIHSWTKWALKIVLLLGSLATLRFIVAVGWEILEPFFHFEEFFTANTDNSLYEYVQALDAIIMLSVGVFTIAGTYVTYVYDSKKVLLTGKDRTLPTVLEGLTSGAVKVKMAGGLIGLSSISLTGTFISIKANGMVDGEFLTWDVFWKKLIIHGALIVGFLAVGLYERATHPPTPHHGSETHKSVDHEV